MRVTALPFVRPADLEPIFAEELSCWKRQLHWDYRPALDLIKRHISFRALPGFALLDETAQPIGYAYSLVDQKVGYLGNLFVQEHQANAVSYRKLITALLEELAQNSAIQRIEGQLFPFNFDFGPSLRQAGLRLFGREYLVRDLNRNELAANLDSRNFLLRSWDPGFFGEAARLIHDSYQNSRDRDLCQDYQSPSGCRRFLGNLLKGPGCGSFSCERSYLVLNGDRRLVALALVSLISSDTAMIPQISVHPDYQRRGLGGFLLQHIVRNSPGLKRITLSVSTGNSGAVRLYKRLGFRFSRPFLAAVSSQVSTPTRPHP